ncbi:MAG TPA: tannase/feruloyl esterase family alpha/beta hydrolase, partial [Vicinamibacterales bacterium]
MIVSLGLALVATTLASTPCQNLQAIALPQATVISAQVIASGIFVPPGGGGRQGGAPAQAAAPIPEHCRVTMVLKPSSDSHINVELWMPTQNWNRKFLAVGNGGFAGSIQGYADMQTA